MDAELKTLLRFTRMLPPVKGAGLVGNRVKDFYCRKKRESVTAGVLGFTMTLDPGECVDGGILFYPQIYDYHERIFVEKNLRGGDVFLDVGANIGFYSLVASRRVGGNGKVIAIEADPHNFEKLQANLSQSGASNVIAVNAGVSDKRETLTLGVNTRGNRGGNSFLLQYESGVSVACAPLLDILKERGITAVAGMKIDIEGFEYRVLSRFFADADRALRPGFIVVEYNPAWAEKAGGNTITLLEFNGYRVEFKSGWNHIMVRRGS